jgi:hypothetical protein
MLSIKAPNLQLIFYLFLRIIMDNTIDYTNNEAHLAESSNIINTFFYKEDRLHRLSSQSFWGYFHLIVPIGLLTLVGTKVVQSTINHGFNYTIPGVVFFCFLTLILGILSYAILSNTKEKKIDKRILEIEINENQHILEQLDIHKLEARLLYAYQEAITKSANNVLNKDIHKQLVKDFNKFKAKANKNDSYDFLRLWSDYDYKLSQAKRQLYN